ncbi:MAG TPA: class I SAM-dependent methyltransferase [Pyrinomonadaceae bacterium]|nr:class I SAM-dependent methyltransferase [Pyrinomonadaceae bacterium]
MATHEQKIHALSEHAAETARGERFEFGKNWNQFLELLDANRTKEAEVSLKEMLAVDSLSGLSFIDVGSGSGLFSLAARSLGARVHSFDYDPQSVACTAELRNRYFPNDNAWKVEEASVLDQAYLESLSTFDVVYSWGVLHHTGQMWKALENVHRLVAPGGKLFIALYNDTGSQSSRWKWIKKTYNQLPGVLRVPYTLIVIAPDELKSLIRSVLTFNIGSYFRSWSQYNRRRGMNRWRDIVDWVGGYPYEVSTPDEVFDFFTARGFILTKLNCGRVGLGCNQFVFRKQCT